jgi:transposase
LFTGWVYDVVHAHNEEVVVGNPQTLAYITRTKRKNDRIDARKLANLLRCEMFPTVHVPTKQVRLLRGLMRYRNFIAHQMTRYKNHTAALLMGDGIEYESRKLHGKKYFERFLKEQEIPKEILMMLKMNRRVLTMLRTMERQILKGLQKMPGLKERIHRLLTIPGVGIITALTWCLEIDTPERFSSINQAVSYCGLCSAQRESGGTEHRGPLSKLRNKHLQWVLIEASKLGVKSNTRLKAVYDKTCRHKDHNSATISVARRLTGWLLAMDKTGSIYDHTLPGASS